MSFETRARVEASRLYCKEASASARALCEIAVNAVRPITNWEITPLSHVVLAGIVLFVCSAVITVVFVYLGWEWGLAISFPFGALQFVSFCVFVHLLYQYQAGPKSFVDEHSPEQVVIAAELRAACDVLLAQCDEFDRLNEAYVAKSQVTSTPAAEDDIALVLRANTLLVQRDRVSAKFEQWKKLV